MFQCVIWLTLTVGLSATTSDPLSVAASGKLKIDGVPAELSFPLAAGANCIVTATVLDAKSERVWLATTRDSLVRIVASEVGPEEYRINLAAEEVGVVLVALASNEFRFFAELDSGQILASLPINYTRKTDKEPSIEFDVFVTRDGESRRVAHHNGVYFLCSDPWVDPLVDGIDVKFEEPQDRDFTVRIREARMPLLASPDRKSYSVRWDQSLRDDLRATGKIHFELDSAGHHQRLSLRVPATELAFPGPYFTATVRQRSSLWLPPSHEYLLLSIGDVSGGAVRVDLRGADGKAFVQHLTMRQGETATFSLKDMSYTLVLRKLRNVLVGTDSAVFDIWRGKDGDGPRIDALLQTLGKSNVVFLRGELEHSGPEAEAHLRSKLDQVTEETISWKQFVETIATKSTTTGEPYRVRSPDGIVMTAEAWIERQK